MDWNGLDPELVQRVRDVLVKMNLLSEGQASSPLSLAPPERQKPKVCPACKGRGPVTGCPRCRSRGKVFDQPRQRSVQSHHDSSVPAGVKLTKRSGPPSKDDSLYDHYLYVFTRAVKQGDQEKVRLLCFLAERDYVRTIGTPDQDPQARLAAQRRVTQTDDRDDKAAMRQVVDLYEGYSRAEAAVLENCSVGFIEKARHFHRRSLEDGREKRGWDGWDEERRVSEIRSRRERNWTQDHVAGDLGVSLRTIQRYWGHASPRKAA